MKRIYLEMNNIKKPTVQPPMMARIQHGLSLNTRARERRKKLIFGQNMTKQHGQLTKNWNVN